jgi:hypothetical protein
MKLRTADLGECRSLVVEFGNVSFQILLESSTLCHHFEEMLKIESLATCSLTAIVVVRFVVTSHTMEENRNEDVRRLIQ